MIPFSKKRAIPFAQQLALKLVSGRSSNKSGNKTDCVAIALKPLFPSTARGVGEWTNRRGGGPAQTVPSFICLPSPATPSGPITIPGRKPRSHEAPSEDGARHFVHASLILFVG